MTYRSFTVHHRPTIPTSVVLQIEIVRYTEPVVATPFLHRTHTPSGLHIIAQLGQDTDCILLPAFFSMNRCD
jgi:hypothetical protein